MKSSKRQRLISFLCVFLVTIISVGSITAMASSKYGIATIKANSATTTIGDVKKEDSTDKHSGMIAQRSYGQKSNFACYVWVKDITKSKVLTAKSAIYVNGNNRTHNLKYKDGVSEVLCIPGIQRNKGLILCHLRRLNRINAEQPCSGQLLHGCRQKGRIP